MAYRISSLSIAGEAYQVATGSLEIEEGEGWTAEVRLRGTRSIPATPPTGLAVVITTASGTLRGQAGLSSRMEGVLTAASMVLELYGTEFAWP
ncbi:MAG: hypothetical protein ACJ77B_04675 [Chloroflexota bacterium]